MSHHKHCSSDKCCCVNPCINDCCCQRPLLNGCGCGNLGFLSGSGGSGIWIILIILFLLFSGRRRSS